MNWSGPGYEPGEVWVWGWKLVGSGFEFYPFAERIASILPSSHTHTQAFDLHDHGDDPGSSINTREIIWKGCAVIGGTFITFVIEVILQSIAPHSHGHSHGHTVSLIDWKLDSQLGKESRRPLQANVTCMVHSWASQGM